MLIIKTEEDRERCTSSYGNHTIVLTMEEVVAFCVTANNAEVGAAIPIVGIPLISLMLSTAILFRMGSRR